MSKRVTWGRFPFVSLTPDQQHLAIEYRAEEIYKARIYAAGLLDWRQAVALIATRETPSPVDEQVRPTADNIYKARAAGITEEMCREAKLNDWLKAEMQLTRQHVSAFLPVEKVPQLKAYMETIRPG